MSQLASQSVYRHAAKPEWGGALIAWERDGKRGYQFEDGRLRVFTSVHYHLLERIDASADRVRTLRALLGIDAPPEVASAPAGSVERPTLDEQIAYFVDLFPGGFAGEKWRSEHRGGSERARKRHRDPAIAIARKELTVTHLTSCLDRRREDMAMQTLATVLGSTDLVAATHVQDLPALPPNRARTIVIGLYELLFGNNSVEVRVVQWVQALTRGTGRKPQWSVATAPLALFAPDHHICVHRASFLAQAASFAPHIRVAVSPAGVDYGPLLAMATRIRARLDEKSCAPVDFLDVHDFMLLTLRAEAVREIAARR